MQSSRNHKRKRRFQKKVKKIDGRKHFKGNGIIAPANSRKKNELGSKEEKEWRPRPSRKKIQNVVLDKG